MREASSAADALIGRSETAATTTPATARKLSISIPACLAGGGPRVAPASLTAGPTHLAAATTKKPTILTKLVDKVKCVSL